MRFVDYKFEIIIPGIEFEDGDNDARSCTFNEALGKLIALQELGVITEFDFIHTYRDPDNKS